jgi:hypothetical protein
VKCDGGHHGGVDAEMPHEDKVAGFAIAADATPAKPTAVARQEEKEGGAEEERAGAVALQQAPGHRAAIAGDRGARSEALQGRHQAVVREVPGSAPLRLP